MKMNKEIYKNSFKNNLGNLLKCSYVVIILQLFFVECRTYSIPTPTARALSPKGFRVSIPGKQFLVFEVLSQAVQLISNIKKAKTSPPEHEKKKKNNLKCDSNGITDRKNPIIY